MRQVKVTAFPVSAAPAGSDHSVRSFSYYITDPLSDPPQQSACRRITPFPTVTAGEPPAPSRPPLYSTCLTISPTLRLNLASTAETSNFPGILVNKRTCTIYSSPSKSANLTPKSTPAAKAANRSSKATIVPHKIRLLANIGSQQQAFNEPGPRPSSHPTHSLPASAQPFTAALPAAAPLAAGPLASVCRG
ncbi:zinc finger protein 771-like [Labeo rohita]|uniref:Zinc finger protein 771-like n=1 Tax=Labeo rohita TaxID=84645 RepID=A0A498M329_LABRO|nr:zinc finger protein 771-like [Labeo rohita]RXN15258.1 zinc finger protein 771-like [Labeo rohita]